MIEFGWLGTSSRVPVFGLTGTLLKVKKMSAYKFG